MVKASQNRAGQEEQGGCGPGRNWLKATGLLRDGTWARAADAAMIINASASNGGRRNRGHKCGSRADIGRAQVRARVQE